MPFRNEGLLVRDRNDLPHYIQQIVEDGFHPVIFENRYGTTIYRGAPHHGALLKEMKDTIQQLQAEVKALRESQPQLLY